MPLSLNTLLTVNLLATHIVAGFSSSASVTVTSGVINVVDEAFSSFNIDPSCNRGFHFTSFDNENLAAAAAGLVPARLRFGGSGADELTYGLTNGSPECAGIPAPTPPDTPGCSYFTRGCLNGTHLERIFKLARSGGVDLIVGVSFGLIDACAAGPLYEWKIAPGGGGNAANLLNGLQDRGLKPWAFELGNEINNKNLNTGQPCNITASQQADAFNAFADMVSLSLPGTLLVGPDTGGANPQEWLQALLPLLNQPLHAVTHHVYNGVGRKNFNHFEQFDSILPEIACYTETVRSLAPKSAIWAGENGPTGGGDDGTCGTTSVCGLFASSLWYADDMALRAKNGFVAHQRQDLFGAMYGLTNSISTTMALGLEDPLSIRADYWISFLLKRTLGLAVLNATSSDPDLRAYAYKGSPPSPFAATNCMQAQQLLLIYLGNSTLSVSLPTDLTGNFAAWTLTSDDSSNPFSVGAKLNDVTLPSTIDIASGIDPRTFLSNITVQPVVGPMSSGITLPPLSTTFICYGGN
jgi:hypothetical protein